MLLKFNKDKKTNIKNLSTNKIKKILGNYKK